MPNPIRWIFDQARKVYNRVRSRSKLIEIRDTYTQIDTERFATSLANDLLNGRINLQQWTLNFREQLKTTYINQYMAGRGGLDAMTQADWGRIGRQLRDQYAYMNQFAAQIARGDLTTAQIEARMKLYFNSATQMFERAQAASSGVVLPQYPGDGRTQCRTNCKCEWDIQEYDDRWDCYWKLNPAEHCPDCIDNSQTWNPLVIRK